METIVYGLFSSCNCRYCFTDYTRPCRKQAILDGKCRACRYHWKSDEWKYYAGFYNKDNLPAEATRTYGKFLVTEHGIFELPEYEPKTPEADASVDADTVNDATAFLETFFKLYPTATEKELAYYVAGNVVEPIGRDYLYSELVNPIFTKDGDNVKVKVAVKFLDNQTKATQVSQYEFVLHKDSNWKIVW